MKPRYWLLLILLGLPSNSSSAVQFRFACLNYEPFCFIQNGQKAGIIVDIARAISKDVGLDISIQLLPYPRMVKYIQTGQADFSIFTRNAINDDYVEYIDRVFSQKTVLLTRKGEVISDYDEAVGSGRIRSIGMLSGTSLSLKIAQDQRIDKQQVDDFSMGLMMLSKDRIDAFLTIDATSFYESEKLGLSHLFEFPGYPLHRLDAWLQVSNRSVNKKLFPDQAVKKSLIKLSERGDIRRIIKKYLGDYHHYIEVVD